MKYLLTLIILLPLFAGAQIKFQTSWESGTRNAGMQLVEDVAPDTGVRISTVRYRSGSKSICFSLKNTDPQPTYGNKRREITVVNNTSLDKVDSSIKWYRFSTYMSAADWQNDTREEVFTQWHDKAINSSTSASPPLSFETKDSRYRFRIRYSLTDYRTGGQRIELKPIDGGPILFDQWVDWVVYYNPRTDGNGRVQIWRNGVSVVNYTGPCNYVGSQPPYMKIGIYKWVWMNSLPSGAPNFRRFYVDMLAYGGTSSSLSTMQLAGTPSPMENLAPTVTPDPPFILLNYVDSCKPKVIASDPESGQLTYSWTKVSGPSATLTNTATATLTAKSLVSGANYVFQCVVTDNVGKTTTAQVTVDVNTPPNVDLSGNITTTMPSGTTTYSVVSSSTDPDGTVSKREWTQISGPTQAVISDSSVSNPVFSGLSDGVYKFQLAVTDNDNAIGYGELTLTISTTRTFIPAWKRWPLVPQ